MRTYVRQSDRGKFSRESMLAAVHLVQQGMSIRKAATEKGVNYKTLSQCVKVKTTGGTLDDASFGYVKARQVISDVQEANIVQYVIHASRIFHGLTTELRRFAYDLATADHHRGKSTKWPELTGHTVL